ncbi:hypothetical protein [Argonema galeatum]|uniref:hypothetical protein n=1 Tax=Argonema galeatum TaxID=2942762 RepID=UPI002011B78F|nr:hypothetical protein [Argonema galeatum]MCL1467581.1 hypothetical protein [Argonema galeatum A003/A1]
MRIRCIANTGAFLSETYLDPAVGRSKETEFQLTIGKEYTVYTLYQWQGSIWYYICDDGYTYYPQQNPAPLFEVIDNRLSSYWRFKVYPTGLLKLAFDEWLSDQYFYDKLTDGEETEILIFEKLKELIDAEALSPAPISSIIESAVLIGNISG